jgi:hypothetical protein
VSFYSERERKKESICFISPSSLFSNEKKRPREGEGSTCLGLALLSGKDLKAEKFCEVAW